MNTLSFPILDIITARKGGSGKTITALVKINEAFNEGLNVLLIDTNDMNPDAADITIGTFDMYAKIFGPKQIKVEERIIAGRIAYKKYIINIKGTGKQKNVGVIWSKGANRGSSHDFWKIISRSKNIIEHEGYQYIVIDTNTAFDSITPDIETLEVRNFIFLNWLSEKLGKYEEANEVVENLIEEIPSKNFALTHILRLGVLSDKRSLLNEFELLEKFRKLMQKKGKNAFVQVVINNYVALSGEFTQKKGFISFVSKIFKTKDSKATMERFESCKSKDTDIQIGNGIILSSKSLSNIIGKYVEEHETKIRKIETDAYEKNHSRNYITKRVLKNLTKVLAKMFLELLKYENETKQKILNLSIIPYYDYDLSTLIYDLKQINTISKDQVSFVEALIKAGRITPQEIAAQIDFDGPMLSIFKLMGYEDIIDKRNKYNLETIFEDFKDQSTDIAVKDIMGFFSGYREKIRTLLRTISADENKSK